MTDAERSLAEAALRFQVAARLPAFVKAVETARRKGTGVIIDHDLIPIGIPDRVELIGKAVEYARLMRVNVGFVDFKSGS